MSLPKAYDNMSAAERRYIDYEFANLNLPRKLNTIPESQHNCAEMTDEEINEILKSIESIPLDPNEPRLSDEEIEETLRACGCDLSL